MNRFAPTLSVRGDCSRCAAIAELSGLARTFSLRMRRSARRWALVLVVAMAVAPGQADVLQRPGDWNGDGFINEADVAAYSACLTGPDQTAAPPCDRFDWDADGDADLVDYGRLQFALGAALAPGDFNADGKVDLVDHAALRACLVGPRETPPAACQVFDTDRDADVDLGDFAALQGPLSDCNLLIDNIEPAGWYDSGPDNSMAEDPDLFRRWCVAREQVFGTRQGLNNIHAHDLGGLAGARTNYAYTGRMMVNDPGGAIGVTFYSDYPNRDAYYRLSADSAWTTFHIHPHPLGDMMVDGGVDDSGVERIVGAWFRYRIEVTSEDIRTVIRAKVWRDGAVEPANWQIDCYDDTPDRLTRGTYGVWGWGPGEKYFDDLHVTALDCGGDADEDGMPDCADGCPADPEKVTPGICGCGVPDADDDGNGVADCLEQFGLCVSDWALSFGAATNSAAFEVWNCAEGVLAYTVQSDAAWLAVSPASGASAGEHDVITATVDRTGLSAGAHYGTITLQAPAAGQTTIINVAVNVGTVTPIARWDVVPRQRINAGETFNCGVVAFSKPGVERVRFAISGQGYSGPSPIDVTEMTHNDRVGVWEYWVPISADAFASDGPITVEATVIGNDGGVRNSETALGSGLEALTLYVNPNGTLPANVAWVAVNGDNATGVVNDPTRPFERVSAAMQAIAALQGGVADGGTVRVRPGYHQADGGDVYGDETAPTVGEWITITNDPAAGGTVYNTVINGRDKGDWTSYYLKASGLTLDASAIINGGNSSDVDRTKRSVWLQNCRIPGDATDFPFPVGSGWRGPHYYTECTIWDQRRATGNGQNHRLMRNLTITDTREDIFQAVPCGINIFVDGVDPGGGSNPEHADVIQSPGATYNSAANMHNWLFYNVVATDLHYQALFSRTGATAYDNAFVNCFFEMRAPVRDGGSGTAMGGKYDHLLLWHCTFIGTDTSHKAVLGRQEAQAVPYNSWQMDNLSVRACLFDRYSSAVGEFWVGRSDVDFLDNHYITPDGIPTIYGPDTGSGTASSGAPGIVTNTASANFGRPSGAGSPLAGRVWPLLIPADATGRPFGATAAVGALAP